MRTPAQTAASRANGAKSKGPITAQGKLNSSRNAIRHGLFADTIVLEAEEKGRFKEFLADLLDEHEPQTITELMLVESIAAARWKQQRIWGMQKAAMDHDVANYPADVYIINPLRAFLAIHNSPERVRTYEHLLRCEIAADRQVSRALHRLQQLQGKRAAQQTAAAEGTQQRIENQGSHRPPKAARDAGKKRSAASPAKPVLNSGHEDRIPQEGDTKRDHFNRPSGTPRL